MLILFQFQSTGPQLPYPSTEQLSIQPPSSIQSGSLTFTVQSPVVAFTAAPAASTTARSSVGYPARGDGLFSLSIVLTS